jgi:hypothetical protein
VQIILINKLEKGVIPIITFFHLCFNVLLSEKVSEASNTQGIHKSKQTGQLTIIQNSILNMQILSINTQ